MIEKRVIPTLQINGKRAVKTVKFGDWRYLGNPANIAKIWSDNEAHEICVMDITGSLNIETLKKIAKNVFVPVSYGGGIKTTDDAINALSWGCEKVILGTNALQEVIEGIANSLGRQAVVVSIDHDEKGMVYIGGGKIPTGELAVNKAKEAQIYGAGEILLHSIDRDGTRTGYDMRTLQQVVDAVNIPVTTCGGANTFEDIKKAHSTGATGAAAGSMFCFDPISNNVLVSYRKK